MKKNTMKLDTFKKIIREIVREEVKNVLHEELKELKKPIVSPNSTKSLTPKKSLFNSIDESSSNKNITLDSLIKETAQNMNRDEYRTIINADSTMINQFNPSMYSPNNNESSIENLEAPVPDFTALMNVMKEKNMI